LPGPCTTAHGYAHEYAHGTPVPGRISRARLRSAVSSTIATTPHLAQR
jgi:hypothetical protein